MPMSAPFADCSTAPEQEHDQQREDEAGDGKPGCGAHGKRFIEAAVADTSPTSDTFWRVDTALVHDIYVGRTDLAADPA